MDPGYDQLATPRYDLKHITSLTSFTKYRVKVVKVLFRLRFIQYEDIFYNNHEFKIIDVNKTYKNGVKMNKSAFHSNPYCLNIFLTKE